VANNWSFFAKQVFGFSWPGLAPVSKQKVVLTTGFDHP
jgi:hypothetical protein